MKTQNLSSFAGICMIILTLLLAACSMPTEDAASQSPTTTVVESEAFVANVEPATEVESEVSAELVAETQTTDNDEVITTESPTTETGEEEVARPASWGEETHSNDADPNYDVVFPQDEVNTMTITIGSAEWQAMLDNMTELYGEPSGQAAGGGRRQAGGERPAGGRGNGGAGGGGGGLNVGGDTNPDYVAATIEFENDVWTNVGIRFKGNSTLTRGWSSGIVELPFKLDFDEFEDEYPEIDNQRFYGFKQLSLSNPESDASYVRTALAYDVLQDSGLVAPETAWYELFVDYGEGPVSFGLYTVVEVVDDTVIETAFGNDDGNIYEGDGTGSSLAEGTFEQIADSFQKENNDEADRSDLEALYNVLHSDTRLTDSDQWRSELEAAFDVDTFLKWLAVNTVIVNWDTYGEMAHNFYLYHDLETDQLTWIGWDYNESIQDGRRGANASLSQQEEADAWPLIRYLLDEPTYYAQYVTFVEEVESDAFSAESINAKLAEWETMLAPYVTDSANFATQIGTITTFVVERNNLVETFLSETSN